jgi:DNA-binding GntR family transcriptional regulator
MSPPGRGPTTRTLVEYASEQLREQILSGELGAGHRIRLDVIAEEFGISAIPLREALRTLAAEGLVTPLAHRGYSVAPTTLADLEETYRIRLELEPLAVRLAVPLLTKADIKKLGTSLDLLGQAFKNGHWPDHRTHHRRFHFGIYERCNSPWLLRFTDMLWANSERYQRMTTQIQGQLTQRAKEHRAILAACRAGDAERAATLMHEHLAKSLRTLSDYLVAGDHMSDAGDGAGPADLAAAAHP